MVIIHAAPLKKFPCAGCRFVSVTDTLAGRRVGRYIYLLDLAAGYARLRCSGPRKVMLLHSCMLCDWALPVIKVHNDLWLQSLLALGLDGESSR